MVVPAQRVSSPSELARLLRALKVAVAAGELEQVLPEASPFATNLKLDEIADAGPWPDYVELRFRRLADGARYKLCVETWHGAGGSWGPEFGSHDAAQQPRAWRRDPRIRRREAEEARRREDVRELRVAPAAARALRSSLAVPTPAPRAGTRGSPMAVHAPCG